MSVVRIFQIAKELNISHTDILSFLNKKGVDIKIQTGKYDLGKYSHYGRIFKR